MKNNQSIKEVFEKFEKKEPDIIFFKSYNQLKSEIQEIHDKEIHKLNEHWLIQAINYEKDKELKEKIRNRIKELKHDIIIKPSCEAELHTYEVLIKELNSLVEGGK